MLSLHFLAIAITLAFSRAQPNDVTGAPVTATPTAAVTAINSAAPFMAPIPIIGGTFAPVAPIITPVGPPITFVPSSVPKSKATQAPTTTMPSTAPVTSAPTSAAVISTDVPSAQPIASSELPSFMPSSIPSFLPSFTPSDIPSYGPSDASASVRGPSSGVATATGLTYWTMSMVGTLIVIMMMPIMMVPNAY